ncbi:MAG: NUDIX hydrolase [Woeseiaceae bacterium]
MTRSTETVVDLLGVIVAVTDEAPRVLVVRNGNNVSLPNGPFDPGEQISPEDGLRRLIADRAGLDLYYVEQLYTFGNRYRTESEINGGPRTISIAYIALTREDALPGSDIRWADWYEFLPWEDWRNGRPADIDDVIAPRLAAWAENSDDDAHNRSERINVTFGHPDAPEMDAVLSLERLELLYDAGLLAESERDRTMLAGEAAFDGAETLGTSMKSDHRRVLATALGRIRGKLAYRPVVFELLPGEFTLLQLQQVAEALSGTHLHKQNFRRLVLNANLVEPIGRTTAIGRGRPAELFRFRREVLGEKLTVGLSRPKFRGE